jgi:hypothetical protein
MEKFIFICLVVGFIADLLKIAESQFVLPVLPVLREEFDNLLLTVEAFLLKLMPSIMRLLTSVVGIGGGVAILVFGVYFQPLSVCVIAATFLISGGIYFGSIAT